MIGGRWAKLRALSPADGQYLTIEYLTIRNFTAEVSPSGGITEVYGDLSR